MRQGFRNLLRTIGFTAGLMVLLVLMSRVTEPKNNYKEDGMENVEANGILSERADSIDVLIIGDSESYSMFSPLQAWEEAGFTSYVIGTGAQKMALTVNMVERAFRTQHPKLVVMETNIMFRRSPLYEILVSRAEKYFPVFLYHDRWKHLQWFDFTKSPRYTYSDELKGFRLHFKKMTREEAAAEGIEEIGAADQKYIRPGSEVYFKWIKALCEKQGAELVLVTAPTLKNWTQDKHDQISDFAAHYDLPLVDLNTVPEVEIDWDTETRDGGDHMNYYGAKKTTTYLTSYLKEQFRLIDRRKDEAYENWNQAAKRYEEILKEQNPQKKKKK